LPIAHVEVDVQFALAERGSLLATPTPPTTLNAVRNLLRSCPRSLEDTLSLQRLQLLSAKINNAELRSYYGTLSCNELRERFAAFGISLQRDKKDSPDAMRRRLAEVDTAWVSARTIHPLQILVKDMTSGYAIDTLIHEQFGCMPPVDMLKYLHSSFSAYEWSRMDAYSIMPAYRQVHPGRGVPRLRFQRKMGGLVPSREMERLLNTSSKEELQENRAKEMASNKQYWEPQPLPTITDDDIKKHRRKILALLQQRWRPLQADGGRLVALLLACKRQFQGVGSHWGVAEMLRKEQFYHALTSSTKHELCELARKMGLRVEERRRETDYLHSLQRYETQRSEVLEGLQAGDHTCGPWKPLAKKNDGTTANLNEKYKGLKRKQLLRHCVNRRLASVDHAATAEQLRRRLHASDLLYDEHFPDDDLASLPWKRLRSSASMLGVQQGDQRSQALVENLTEFDTYRYVLMWYNRLTKLSRDTAAD
jgi:hypothetical protein